MNAPQIDSFMFHYHREEYNLDRKSSQLLDRLYLLLSEIEPCGSDERRTVWIRAGRGTLDDYGDYDMLHEDGEVDSREQFEENWRLDYPDEYYYYELTTIQYYLTLSQNEFCCPEEAVRFYIALRKNGIPVYLYDGAKIEKFLSGKGKIGIIPCFDESWEYFYGGFDDKDVGEFINLPDEPCDELIKKITWEKIPEVRLTGGE